MYTHIHTYIHTYMQRKNTIIYNKIQLQFQNEIVFNDQEETNKTMKKMKKRRREKERKKTKNKKRQTHNRLCNILYL